MPNLLTKSNFLSYLECPYQFYHYTLHPDQKPETKESDYLSIENGMGFEETVYSFLDESFKTEHEFKTDQLYARTDSVRLIDDTTVELYEVKSSKYDPEEKIDKKYIIDIAVQKIIAERAGYTVQACHLISSQSGLSVFNGDAHTKGHLCDCKCR